MLEDKVLLWQCQHGNRTAYQRIYEKYEGDLRTLAGNLLEDKAIAEDIVHDVFLSFLLRVETFELRSSLAGYLKTCIVNRVRNHVRKRQDQPLTSRQAEPVIPKDNEPIQIAIRSEEQRNVGWGLNQLPYEQREAVVLHLHGQMKFKTIAVLQKVSIKTAHNRYKSGLDRLKWILNGRVKNEIDTPDRRTSQKASL